MPWWADYHSHSNISIDCGYSMVDMAEGALAAGVRELAVTDHADFDPLDGGYNYYDYARYLRNLAAARATLDGRITLRCALELGYQPERHAEISGFLAGKSYDFVLGSIHISGGQNVCDAQTWPAHVATGDATQAYGSYFTDVAACAAGGLVDVLSHFDLCKRYGVLSRGPLHIDDVTDLVDSALRAAVEHHVGIEINTSGLRQAPREAFPGPQILRRYVELGGEWITLGSDSHYPEHVAAGFDVALAMARAAGVRWLATFVARQPHFHALDAIES